VSSLIVIKTVILISLITSNLLNNLLVVKRVGKIGLNRSRPDLYLELLESLI